MKTAEMQIEPLMLRAKQAADFIGVSSRTLQNMRASGRLPLPVKLGGCVLWRRCDLERWVALGCPNVERFNAIMGGDNG